MEKEKSYINIVIVSLDDKFSKNVANDLASKLDMFLADCKDLIEYDLIDPKEILNKCGFDYLKEREKGVIKNCAEYQNTVITIKYDLLKEYYEVFRDSMIIYLELSNMKVNQSINKIDYDNRNNFIKGIADLTILLDKKSKVQAVKKIIEKLGEMV